MAPSRGVQRPLEALLQLSRNRRRGALLGRIVHWIFFGCAILSIITTVGIVVSLLSQSLGFFREIHVWDFLFGTNWSPFFETSMASGITACSRSSAAPCSLPA